MPHNPRHTLPSTSGGPTPGVVDVLPNQSLAPTSLPSPQTKTTDLTEEELELLRKLLADKARRDKLALQTNQISQVPPKERVGFMGPVGAVTDVLKVIGQAPEFLNYALTNPRFLQALGSASDQPQVVTPSQVVEREAQIKAMEQEPLPFGETPGTDIYDWIERTTSGALEDIPDVAGFPALDALGIDKSKLGGKIAAETYSMLGAPLTYGFALTPEIGAVGKIATKTLGPKTTSLLSKVGFNGAKPKALADIAQKASEVPGASAAAKGAAVTSAVVKAPFKLAQAVAEPIIGSGNIPQRIAGETIVGTAAGTAEQYGGGPAALAGGILSAVTLQGLRRGKFGMVGAGPAKPIIRSATRKIVGPPADATDRAARLRAQEFLEDPVGAASKGTSFDPTDPNITFDTLFPPIKSSGTKSGREITNPNLFAKEHADFMRGLTFEIKTTTRSAFSTLDEIGRDISKHTTVDDDGYELVKVINPDGSSEDKFLGEVVEMFDNPRYTPESLGAGLHTAIQKLYDVLDEGRSILKKHNVDHTGGKPAKINTNDNPGMRFFPRVIKDVKKGAKDTFEDREIIDSIEKSKGENAPPFYANTIRTTVDDSSMYPRQQHQRIKETYGEGVVDSKESITAGDRSAWLYDSPVQALKKYLGQGFLDVGEAERMRHLLQYGRTATPESPINEVREMHLDSAVLDGIENRLGKKVRDAYEDLIFDKRIADRILDMTQARPPRKGKKDPFQVISDAMKKINKTTRPYLATLDLSGFFVTNGMLAVAKPNVFWKNVIPVLADTAPLTRLGKKRVNDFLNDPETQEIGQWVTFVDPMDPKGDMVDYMVTAAGNAVTKTLKAGAEPFNRGFAMTGNRNRKALFKMITREYKDNIANELMERGVPIENIDFDSIFTDDVLHEIGRHVDRMTGISNSEISFLEDQLTFAPSFYRSILSVLNKNLESGSLEGDLARQYMGLLATNGLLSVMAAALINGDDVADRVTPIRMKDLDRGHLTLNPNFGTIRVDPVKITENIAKSGIPGTESVAAWTKNNLDQTTATTDISVFGPLKSIMGLGIATADAGLNLLFGNEGDDDNVVLTLADKFSKTKGAPVVTAIRNLLIGKTFAGYPFMTLDSDATGLSIDRFTLGENDTWGGIATGNLKGAQTLITPFTAQEFVETYDDVAARQGIDQAITGKQNAGQQQRLNTATYKAFINSLGTAAAPLSEYEELDILAREMYGKSYEDLTPVKKRILRDSTVLMGRNRPEPTKAEGKFFEWNKEHKKDLGRTYQSLYEMRQNGELTYEGFRQAIEKARIENFVIRKNMEDELGVIHLTAKAGTPQAALQLFYQIAEDITEPITGERDWSEFEERVSVLMDQIKLGQFGNVTDAERMIEERTAGMNVPDDVKFYFENKEIIKSYDYWEQTQIAFQHYKAEARQRANDSHIDSLYDLQKAQARAMNPASVDYDPKKVAKIQQIINKITNRANVFKQRLRSNEKGLRDALFENGYISEKERNKGSR